MDNKEKKLLKRIKVTEILIEFKEYLNNGDKIAILFLQGSKPLQIKIKTLYKLIVNFLQADLKKLKAFLEKEYKEVNEDERENTDRIDASF
jgi:hypothetical protein